MILLQFMHAFPGVKCSIPDGRGKADLWQIATVHGPLPHGANAWATAHGVVFFQTGPVYSLRWSMYPHKEGDMIRCIYTYAEGGIDLLPPSSSSTKAARNYLEAFELAAREAGLLP